MRLDEYWKWAAMPVIRKLEDVLKRIEIPLTGIAGPKKICRAPYVAARRWATRQGCP